MASASHRTTMGSKFCRQSLKTNQEYSHSSFNWDQLNIFFPFQTPWLQICTKSTNNVIWWIIIIIFHNFFWCCIWHITIFPECIYLPLDNVLTDYMHEYVMFIYIAYYNNLDHFTHPKNSVLIRVLIHPRRWLLLMILYYQIYVRVQKYWKNTCAFFDNIHGFKIYAKVSMEGTI